MRKKRLIYLLLALFAAVLTAVCPSAPLRAETAEADLSLTSRSALLMEASTGTVLYEQNADEELSPASITKIMTLLLIFDALEEGKIALTDQVTTSAYAKSMGGSQVFLEEGEQQTVETMIKCIVIASGNDAAVAMAEHLAGSETEFVRQMNARAEGLGMSGTHFEDCCGLSESDSHRTTARDVAIMSRELITRYPQVSDYATIWMENITHITANGTSEFTLSNTNKLLKMTQSFRVTGLKTGSTSLAKYCFSGTAEQDGIHLIAVVMAAPDYKTRFSEAQSMLNYGFSLCSLYEDTDSGREELPELPVERGKTDTVPLAYRDSFSYLSTTGEDFSQIERRITLASSLIAPAEEGTVVGSLEYILDGRTLGSVNIVTTAAVEQAGYTDILHRFWETFLGAGFAV
ncbi:MAG: D-alanyl-D-alanine carboxypeptidase [Lachnospiraceae bacterium]|nr:D-alanyl-D-alanine carboxypeptidase [Lachnospiraceae bacterium]